MNDETDIENKENIVEIWKKTVDVQQHFNDIALKIRNLAITILGAFLAAIGLAYKENQFIVIFDISVSIATFLCMGAILVWVAFFFMDRFWYHKLLLGAVKYGSLLEKENQQIFGSKGLTTLIGEESPIKFCNFSIHSTAKFWIFYSGGFILLLLLAILFHFSHAAPKPEQSNNVEIHAVKE